MFGAVEVCYLIPNELIKIVYGPNTKFVISLFLLIFMKGMHIMRIADLTICGW